MPDDIVFTYRRGNATITHTLQWVDRINTPQALGVWHVGGKAWKVYSTISQFRNIFEDYYRAETYVNLPMGSPQFIQGTLRRGTTPASQGFVIVTRWSTGAKFINSSAAFRSALRRAKFPQELGSTDYQRLRAGALAASSVGLTGPRGFVEGGVPEPLFFIDIHTSWNQALGVFGTSEAAQEIFEIAVNHGL